MPAHENGTIEQAEQRQQQRYGAQQARKHDARVRQLEGDSENAAQEQQRDQVGVEQDVQEPELQRQLAALQRGPGQRQREVLAHRDAAVALGQQARARRSPRGR